MPAGAIERYTERLAEQEMGISHYGENDFGFVYVQGEDTPNSEINDALKRAGGKPDECALRDYTAGGTGKAKPEYIITFRRDLNTILLAECKKSDKKHRSETLSRPKDYAVDGALYYAKYLKEAFNVIAVGISGTKKAELHADAFYWPRGQDDFFELTKAKNIVLEPENYLKLIHGEKVQKAYSLSEVSATAAKLHERLCENAASPPVTGVRCKIMAGVCARTAVSD